MLGQLGNGAGHSVAHRPGAVSGKCQAVLGPQAGTVFA
jgi:hypothetical protein